MYKHLFALLLEFGFALSEFLCSICCGRVEHCWSVIRQQTIIIAVNDFLGAKMTISTKIIDLYAQEF